MIRLLLIGSQELLSVGIQDTLEEQPVVKIIGTAKNLLDATQLTLTDTPKVILVVSQIKQRHELEYIRQLQHKYTQSYWCAIVPSFDTIFIPYVMQFPMHGYLSTQADRQEIVKALKLVATGQQYVSLDVQKAFNMEVWRPIGSDMSDLLLYLSDREAEIAWLIVQGLSLEDIATRLNIKSTTVSSYRCRIFEKCKNVHSNSELVRLVLHYNLLPLLEKRQQAKVVLSPAAMVAANKH